MDFWASSWVNDGLAKFLPWGWLALFIVFVVFALRTNRIQSKEAVPKRILDKALLWASYVLIFTSGPIYGVFNRRIIPPASLAIQIGAAVALLGLLLTLWARIVLGRYWSGIVALKEDHQLVRSGPYAVVRHPLYTGLITAAYGTAFAQDHWNCLLGALLMTVCFLRRAQSEDELMSSRFGQAFEEYRRQTGQIVPGVG
jgi:protein-S-isoprenylcysteine O-methyltransferase Ste14